MTKVEIIMKLYLASDLHVNHEVPYSNNQLKLEKNTHSWVEKHFTTPDSHESVLLLPGDFGEYNAQTVMVFEKLSTMFKCVVATTGNHDEYKLSKKAKKKHQRVSRAEHLKEELSHLENVHLLYNDVVTLDGKVFAGTPLWYSVKTPEGEAFFNNSSNDSKYAFDTVSMLHHSHKRDMAFYDSLENVDVMLTHVPPMHPPFSPYPYNECYVTPVAELKAPVWVCGHQHTNGTWETAGTQFYMNTMGYPDQAKDFKLLSIEL